MMGPAGNELRRFELRPDVSDERDYSLDKLQLVATPSLPLETSILSWKKAMTPVKHQGRKGSCVGFAVAAMKEWQEREEHKKEVSTGKKDIRKGKVYNLSEQWIYHQAKKIDAWPGQEGTSIREAMKVLCHIGCPPEAGWPYSDVKVGEPESWAHMIALWSKIGSYYRVRGSDGLMTGLSYGPVVIGVPVYREFFTPRPNGTIAMPAKPRKLYGGHAICIVGFDATTKKFEFKNSWGTSWGNKGYGQLHFKYIDSFMWDAWVAVDTRVKKIKEGDIPEIEQFKRV